MNNQIQPLIIGSVLEGISKVLGETSNGIFIKKIAHFDNKNVYLALVKKFQVIYLLFTQFWCWPIQLYIVASKLP